MMVRWKTQLHYSNEVEMGFNGLGVMKTFPEIELRTLFRGEITLTRMNILRTRIPPVFQDEATRYWTEMPLASKVAGAHHETLAV